MPFIQSSDEILTHWIGAQAVLADAPNHFYYRVTNRRKTGEGVSDLQEHITHILLRGAQKPAHEGLEFFNVGWPVQNGHRPELPCTQMHLLMLAGHDENDRGFKAGLQRSSVQLLYISQPYYDVLLIALNAGIPAAFSRGQAKVRAYGRGRAELRSP